MSYETKIDQNVLTHRYQKLKNSTIAAEERIQNFMDEATQLHADTTDAGEKAEIVALRDALIAKLRTILGV